MKGKWRKVDSAWWYNNLGNGVVCKIRYFTTAGRYQPYVWFMRMRQLGPVCDTLADAKRAALKIATTPVDEFAEV